jgi:hypothetical protein
MILHHMGGLEVLVIDRVILTDRRQRGLMVEVGTLPPHLLVLLDSYIT